MVDALDCVDEVIVYTEINPATLEKIEFDILALGEDQCGDRFDLVAQWCYENGKDVVRLKRTQGISSSAIKVQKGI
jgi:glycerol-3-phosphate cytidylyltransferase